MTIGMVVRMAKRSWPIRVTACVIIAAIFAVICYKAWVRSPFYFPPLVTAARTGDTEQVAGLIALGADLNRKTSIFGADNFTGWTALMWAAHGRHSTSVQLLVDAGADSTIQDRFGRTALHIVFDGEGNGSFVSCVETLLVGGADVQVATTAGVTPLHSAVLRGDRRSIELLIDAGADMNAVDMDGATVLYYAVFYRRDVEIVQLLLDRGADVAQRLPWGRKLYEAVAESDVAPAIAEAINRATAK